VRARSVGPVHPPRRGSQPDEPGRKRRGPAVFDRPPLTRVFLAIVELVRTGPVAPGLSHRACFGEVRLAAGSQRGCGACRSRRGHSPWSRRMQRKAFSVGWMSESNDALKELWGDDPVLRRGWEERTCWPVAVCRPRGLAAGGGCGVMMYQQMLMGWKQRARLNQTWCAVGFWSVALSVVFRSTTLGPARVVGRPAAETGGRRACSAVVPGHTQAWRSAPRGGAHR
jgi:hypothetical protein